MDFTEARDSEWQWHQLGYVQVYTSLQADNHDSTTPLSFLQAGCPFCHPTNSVKALKHQLGYVQVCTSLQADNHDSTPPLSFLQAGCPFCHPTNSVKALKQRYTHTVQFASVS